MNTNLDMRLISHDHFVENEIINFEGWKKKH